jgi:hypothetical protein
VPLTTTATVQDITAVTRGRGGKRQAAPSNKQVDAALRMLGLGGQLNTVIPSRAASDGSGQESGG